MSPSCIISDLASFQTPIQISCQMHGHFDSSMYQPLKGIVFDNVPGVFNFNEF